MYVYLFALMSTLRLFVMQGSVAIAGAAVRWLRDNLGIIKSSSEIGENGARKVCWGSQFFVSQVCGGRGRRRGDCTDLLCTYS